MPPICVVVESGSLLTDDLLPVASARRVQFVYNSTGNRVQLVYHKYAEHLSNPDPTWIYFRIWRTSQSQQYVARDESHLNVTTNSSPSGRTVSTAPEDITYFSVFSTYNSSPRVHQYSLVYNFTYCFWLCFRFMRSLNER